MYCKIYKVIAIVLLILGFFGGIVLGDIYSIPLSQDGELSWKNLYPSESTEKFNSTLMLGTWLSSFVLSVFIFSIYSICSRLEIIIENTTIKNEKSDSRSKTSVKKSNSKNTEKIIQE